MVREELKGSVKIGFIIIDMKYILTNFYWQLLHLKKTV